jgi:hypothetical protein
LVFLDETGTTTKMTRLRGGCLKGQRLRSKAPFEHRKTQTFIAGLRCDGLTNLRDLRRDESGKNSGVLCGFEQRRGWLNDRVEGQRRQVGLVPEPLS